MGIFDNLNLELHLHFGSLSQRAGDFRHSAGTIAPFGETEMCNPFYSSKTE